MVYIIKECMESTVIRVRNTLAGCFQTFDFLKSKVCIGEGSTLKFAKIRALVHPSQMYFHVFGRTTHHTRARGIFLSCHFVVLISSSPSLLASFTLPPRHWTSALHRSVVVLSGGLEFSTKILQDQWLVTSGLDLELGLGTGFFGTLWGLSVGHCPIAWYDPRLSCRVGTARGPRLGRPR